MRLKGGGRHLLIVTFTSILLVVLIYFLFPHILKFLGNVIGIFLPFILGYGLSLIINPLVDNLRTKLKLPRGLSAILVIVLTLGIIGGIVTGIVVKLVEEIRSLYEHYPELYKKAMSLEHTGCDKIKKGFFGWNYKMLLKDLIKDENIKIVKEKYAQIYAKQVDKKIDKLIGLI